MKLCKDCKYKHVPYAYGFGQPLICSHPKAPIDPVTGDKDGSCSLMRSRNCCIEQCGVDGDWFEQAPPPPPEIKPYQVMHVETEEDRAIWKKVKRWFI